MTVPGQRLRVLALDANGYSRKEVLADTLLLGVLQFDYNRIPPGLRDLRYVRNLKHRYDALGYIGDWREALCSSPELDTDVCNTTNLVEFRRYLRHVREYDVVIVLHSAAGDDLSLLQRAIPSLADRRGRLVVFIGNEFDLMEQKIGFLVETGADFVCSQLPIEAARWLYAECEGTEVLAMPHALNPKVYRPDRTGTKEVDIRFVGAVYSAAIGDLERTGLIEAIAARGPQLGVTLDIRVGTVPRAHWAELLRSAHGTIGGESGTYYLDRRSEILGRARAYLDDHPGVTFDELFEACFADTAVPHVSGKCVSSRHFEAIGTKTCQILVEGGYNGILEPGEHYIAVRKDLSNLDDAVARFRDRGYRDRIVEGAYERVLDGHTYADRVSTLASALGA